MDNKKVLNATKWSTITEIMAKLVTPITSMILARLLAPEAFGVVATVTMVVNFAEIFSDSGFQKYLIQHEFKDDRDRNLQTNVAFWTNLGVALFLWAIIAIFNEQIAILVGSEGKGIVLVVAGLSLPLLAFSSIQMALMRRDLEFDKLFKVRIVSLIVPFAITIPLAYLGFGYWALVIGTLAGNLANAIALMILTGWKPTFFYDFQILKGMLSFSLWTIMESFSVWLTNWADIFIVGKILNEHYLGVYKTAPSTVGGIIGIVTAATTNILFATLSRLQNDTEEYNKMYMKFQKYVGMLVIPMGVGIFVFRQLVTDILLGSQWVDAVMLIGLWGITSAFIVVFSNYPCELYRSKGKPVYTVIAQWAHLIVLIPVCYITAKIDFNTLIWARSLVRFELILVHFIILAAAFKINPFKMVKVQVPFLLCAAVMGVAGYGLLQVSTSIVWQIISIVICIVFYFALLLLTGNKKDLLDIAKMALDKIKKGN